MPQDAHAFTADSGHIHDHMGLGKGFLRGRFGACSPSLPAQSAVLLLRCAAMRPDMGSTMIIYLFY
eukprot:6212125-Pleurochrysis_carterae.AAC.5